MSRPSCVLNLMLAPVLCAPLLVSAAPVYSITSFTQGTSLSGINNAGQVIGTGGYGAVISSGGTMSRLYAPDNLLIVGRAINDMGDAVVQHSESSGWRTLILSGSTATELGSLGYSPFTSASAINNAGQVTGSSGHAFLYQRGSALLDLGTLGGPDSWGNGLIRAYPSRKDEAGSDGWQARARREEAAWRAMQRRATQHPLVRRASSDSGLLG